jgi:SSS family solute:Na+ symporter
MANFHWNPSGTMLALWIVILGGIGQNISSYSADQAVVQRYMTTPDIRRAASSIWSAAILAIPASILFFSLGAGLYVFYKTNPGKLDPTFMTDQIFPLFIAREAPAGIAGLIVAGVFAAAQSTVSTSMNSSATAVVTDFLRPFYPNKTEQGYLRWARLLTFLFGAAGTLLGLLFVDPSTRSLFDEFLWVIGMFMGVLGGLFLLGILTRRANSVGGIAGALSGTLATLLLKTCTSVNGYIFATVGIVVCFGVGYLVSLIFPGKSTTEGLTIFTLTSDEEKTE